MTPSSLLELADRVEQASGPDRELDALIRCAVFAPEGSYVKQSPINGAWCIYEIGYNGKERGWEPRGLSLEQRAGEFTASLDAAMSLVPEGLSFEVRRSGSGDQGQATIWDPMCIPGHPSQVRVTGCATPALALTAACLRALAGRGG